MKASSGKRVLIATRLPGKLVSSLASEARARRVQKQKIVQAAIEEFLSPQKELDREAALERNFKRLERHFGKVLRELEINQETLALFIKVWFNNTSEVPDAHKEAASLQGQRRFQRFLEALGKQIGSSERELTHHQKSQTTIEPETEEKEQ